MKLFDRIKAKIGGEATFENEKDFQSTIKSLLHVQLSNNFDDLHNAFSTFMTDIKAAGYLYGFHDAMAQHIYGRKNKEICQAEITSSYAKLFGQQAGFCLWNKSLSDFDTPEFKEAMFQGGKEMFDLIDHRLPPLGLKNYLAFGDWKLKNRPAGPIEKFAEIISTWNPKQAEIALAILAAIIGNDRAHLESLLGKGTTIESAMGHLTIIQLRALVSTIKEIDPDHGLDDDNEDEDD